MMNLLGELGVMRLLLLGVVIACAPLALFANVEPEGLGVISAYVAPALVVILLFVLLLDALMSKVFAIDLPDEQRGTMRVRMRANLLGVLVIALSWGPYFYSLTQR